MTYVYHANHTGFERLPLSNAANNPGERPASPLYICAFCNSPFRLPAGQSVEIRYIGRNPEVECPTCKLQREGNG